ncbi:MAG: zinc-binding alcohol dehydrogenase family protein [Verrucomicrobia bacterium]|nr:zinc-binding alcohol dehydrogenase family protein [Verrucomicrobiota bacterium]
MHRPLALEIAPMKALYLTKNSDRWENLTLTCEERPRPVLKPGECLVKVASSGVNPSDGLGALGYFPHAKLPRIPGRDFAGTVAEGKHAGKKVWGTGGAAGLDFDGTHAEYAAIPESALAEIPHNLSLLEAGAQTLPFVTAYYALVERAHLQPNQTALIIGAFGQVGRAAYSICRWQKARPIALLRTPEDVQKARDLGWEAYCDTLPTDLTFDLILNPIGNRRWNSFMSSLKRFGKMVLIAAPEGTREISIHLLNLYRANQEILGINSVDLDFVQSAALLQKMKPGFESGELEPLPIDPSATFSLEQAQVAYKKVLQGSKGKRVVLSIAE